MHTKAISMPKGISWAKLLISNEDIQKRNSEGSSKVPLCVKAEGELRDSKGRQQKGIPYPVSSTGQGEANLGES